MNCSCCNHNLRLFLPYPLKTQMTQTAYSVHKWSKNPWTRICSLRCIIPRFFLRAILWAQNYHSWIFLSYLPLCLSFNLSTEATENLWSISFWKHSAQNQMQYSCQGLTTNGTLSMSCSNSLRYSPWCLPLSPKPQRRHGCYGMQVNGQPWPDVTLTRWQCEKLHTMQGEKLVGYLKPAAVLIKQ